MFEDHNDTIYEIIKSSKLIAPAELEEVVTSQADSGKSLADFLVDTEMVERTMLLSIIADYLGYTYRENLPETIPEAIASTIPSETALTYAIVPFELNDTTVSLFAKDPFNASIIDVLTFSLNKDVKIIVCDPNQIDKLITATYGEEKSSIDDILGDIADDYVEHLLFAMDMTWNNRFLLQLTKDAFLFCIQIHWHGFARHALPCVW